MKSFVSFYEKNAGVLIVFNLSKLFGVIKKQDEDGFKLTLNVAWADTIDLNTNIHNDLCQQMETFFNENKVFDESWCKVVIAIDEDCQVEETFHIKASYISFVNYDEDAKWLTVVTSSNYDFNISDVTPEIYKAFCEDWKSKIAAGDSYETIEINTPPSEEKILPPVA